MSKAVITLVAIPVAIGLAALVAKIVQLLWNFLVPVAFGGPELTFLQTWAGLLIINFLTLGLKLAIRSRK